MSGGRREPSDSVRDDGAVPGEVPEAEFLRQAAAALARAAASEDDGTGVAVSAPPAAVPDPAVAAAPPSTNPDGSRTYDYRGRGYRAEASFVRMAETLQISPPAVGRILRTMDLLGLRQSDEHAAFLALIGSLDTIAAELPASVAAACEAATGSLSAKVGESTATLQAEALRASGQVAQTAEAAASVLSSSIQQAADTLASQVATARRALSDSSDKFASSCRLLEKSAGDKLQFSGERATNAIKAAAEVHAGEIIDRISVGLASRVDAEFWSRQRLMTGVHAIALSCSVMVASMAAWEARGNLEDARSLGDRSQAAEILNRADVAGVMELLRQNPQLGDSYASNCGVGGAGRAPADGGGIACRLVVYAVNPNAGVDPVRRGLGVTTWELLNGWALAVIGMLAGMAVTGLAAAVKERIRPAVVPAAKKARRKPTAIAAA